MIALLQELWGEMKEKAVIVTKSGDYTAFFQQKFL